VITASSLIPVGYLSDKYGRKWVFTGTNFIDILACYVLIIATKIEMLYLGMFLIGMGHPGRMIVAFQYCDEFVAEHHKALIMPMN